ncbi:L-type lectin-domain containing receptor kinase IX.1-like [Curcuma longa]|uniref:L-type lectin-domain containing receptor kinase IX.1-like n=1 Tax=Curcuma longa TaxID=136217 RepID=UPI003D9E37FD
MARLEIKALFVCLCLSAFLPLPASSLFFNFSDFSQASNSLLLPSDDASKNGSRIVLTKVLIRDSTGRVEYAEPLRLWDSGTDELTDFTTSFSFVIDSSNKSEFADGLAFFLSSEKNTPSYARGGFLGVFCNSSVCDSAATKAAVVAVEFDTFSNDWDPPGVHLGIDVDSIVSAVNVTWNVDIREGKTATAWVHYDSKAHNLSVLVSYGLDPATGLRSATALSFVVDLRKVLPEKVVIGFSATTGNLTETHSLLSWSFNSTLQEKEGVPTVAIAAGIAAGAIAFVAMAAGLIWWLIMKSKPPVSDVVDDDGDDEDENDAIDGQFERESGPKRYPYQELALATRNFAEEGKLGEGGFGSVYRGRLSGEDVAIKRLSKEGRQGKKEYISEVTIISRLRHRNLVQLLGWCHCRGGEFLLVYEFMPNGSLDSHLHRSAKCLQWRARHKAALGLASALFYLHHECEPGVVHRDVKPSNVMLDSAFNAKLGDFGLARLVANDGRNLQTTLLAGTLAYMAPEYYHDGKASKETDVYSFGIVALEIASGRPPMTDSTLLVEWVWGLYGKGAILEAADERLGGDFDRKEMESVMVVGLWCAHPDCELRPTIQQAFNVLTMEKELPSLPLARPRPMYHQPSFNTASTSTKFLSLTMTGTGSTTASASASASASSA